MALALLFSAACTTEKHPVSIEFSATWNGQALHCSDAALSLTDLRFFVSDIVLLGPDGRESPLALNGDQRWQQASVGLVDLENGQGRCLNGTAESNARLSGLANTDGVTGLRFTVGVPFELNHADPLLAAAPLNDGAMHWHWRSGYKFMRAGIANGDAAFWLHLGSTACNGTVQAISACDAPNRVQVELEQFDPHRDRVEVDLGRLFAGVDLDDGATGDCSSGPAESQCAAPFAALGLPFGSGTPVAEEQGVFGVRR